VCSEPRGVAYDPATDQLHVACTSGELVSFAASGGEPTRRLRIDGDLRDVVVSGSQLIVTRFRTAEVLTVGADGAVVDRVAPPIVKRPDASGGHGPGPTPSSPLVDAVPAVAWRAVALPDGRLLVAHQRQIKSQLGMMQDGYGGGCGGGLVESALSVVQPGSDPVAVAPFGTGALPIDIAVAASTGMIAVISAGSHLVTVASPAALALLDRDGCPPGSSVSNVTFEAGLGAPSSVAFASDAAILVYYPEVPALVVHAPLPSAAMATITLPGGLGYDAGRGLFHTQTVLGIACASCHPEGRDDGLVWDFAELGLRRTQSVAGHILRRAPYHWGADMVDLDQLMDNVFTNRMGGGVISRSERRSLGPWLDRVPAPVAAAPLDPAAAQRGQQLFESAALACATCHAGELLTNNQRFDVGTGGTFKVPSLVGVGARPPYLHDGCAATLVDRFGPCGGGDQHGHTSALTGPQLADLIAYLESL